MSHMSLRYGFCLLGAAVFVAGCSSDDPVSGPPPALASGRFVDHPVEGIAFHTPSQSGFTTRQGGLLFRQRETVLLSVGDVVIGQATGRSAITPLNLAATDDINDPRVANRAR